MGSTVPTVALRFSKYLLFERVKLKSLLFQDVSVANLLLQVAVAGPEPNPPPSLASGVFWSWFVGPIPETYCLPGNGSQSHTT